MFPFWEKVVAPVIQAAGAKRIVEIGALRGETTALVLEALGPDAEFHVVDPLPEFDPAEHERRFPGRYIFHRDLSLNVLPHLPPMDAALVDGDHNWYTVYNELKQLATTAREAGARLPVLILHDVCWPYGRRDLYYAPEQIPDEFRQPYERKGMRPGRKGLVPGGLNPSLHHAVKEGGPRNGVMTALDDFIAEYDRPLRRVVIPIYFGLAIVVEQDHLRRKPELAALLDHLESPAGTKELLLLSEQIRLDFAVVEQAMIRQREVLIDRGVRRYLDLLKSALLDELYIDNEARIEYLLECATKGRPVEPSRLADPRRGRRDQFQRIEQLRRSGVNVDDKGLAAFFPFTSMGRARIDALELALDDVRRLGVEGDLVDCGTGLGGSAVFMRGHLEAHDARDRTVWVVDRFRPSYDTIESAVLGSDLNRVREAFERFGLLDDRVRFAQGELQDALDDAPIGPIALLRLGEGLGDSAGALLDRLYDRVAENGFVFADGYGDPKQRAAVDEFRARKGVTAPLERIDAWSVCWRKQGGEGVATAKPAPLRTAKRAPLAPPVPDGAIDLSVVVVVYNMRREAPRTLHSLTRAYQQGVDDLDYEVIVLENGSAPDQKLGAELVESFGPEFRYVDLGDDSLPSPTAALNHGIRLARGRALALMIDGAHMLTPGVLRYGTKGLAAYEPAVVATQQWYLGPMQQPEAVALGYDQSYEDELLDGIGWPADGYRLFEISHFIGDRDWLDGLVESNCLFVPRSLLEQIGGFDDSFEMPGGGYANLDLFERVSSAPGVTVVSILGEGSFHQVHGGTTTNDAKNDDRRKQVFSYGEHYRDLRGRVLAGAAKPTAYVGAMPNVSARRTRARRMTARALVPSRTKTGPDGIPEQPILLPDELKSTFIEAYWNSLAWRRATWLGHPIDRPPTDLLAYQEIIGQLRPDWIVDVGSGHGGRALFLASICELYGHGRVLSVDAQARPDRPQHPRITYLHAKTHTEDGFRKVREVVGDGSTVLVFIGTRAGRARVIAEFEGYAPLVPVGSYVIVEDTIVNGHPVWPGFGPGPREAIRQILQKHGAFVADPAPEKFGLTFSEGGFLKRIR
jgi:cephalosporin hydroxylase